MSDEHEGWSAVVRRDGELVGKGRRRCRCRWLSHARGGVGYHSTRGGGAERRQSAGCRASPTASVRDHVPVVHGDAAKCAKMEACVVCCVWTGVREEGNKLPDLTPESSSYEMACLVGWI